MNADYVQDVRLKLQKRAQRVNAADPIRLSIELDYFISFCHNNRLIADIITGLVSRYPGLDDSINAMYSNGRNNAITAGSEEQHAALSYLLLRRWAGPSKPGPWRGEARLYSTGGTIDDAANGVRKVFLSAFHDYIEEQLDDTRLTLTLLTRYKHRCEWFHRERLNALYHGDTKNGEANLARDLYEYLFDQGLQFHIEPKSADGIPDLIGDQTDDGRIVADAKIFDGDGRGKDYIIKGFNQVYTYTRNYNEPVGYMVIFRVCDTDLNFDVSGTGMSAPFVTHNGKTIFFINVDIHAYGTSASKRGKVRCVTIQESELITKVQSQQLSGDSDA